MKAGELNLILCIPPEGKRKPTPLLPSNLPPLPFFFNAFVKLWNNIIFSSCSYLLCINFCKMLFMYTLMWLMLNFSFYDDSSSRVQGQKQSLLRETQPSTTELPTTLGLFKLYCLPRINHSSYDIWCLLNPSWVILKMLYWRQFSEHGWL